MATGRTSLRYFKLQIEDAGGVMRDIPIKTVGGMGITFDEVDVSAVQEAIKGMFSGQGNFAVTITGPFDNRAAATASASGESAAAKLSGSHTVLSALNGGITAKSLGMYIGIQADWTTGDPVFGAVDCCLVTDYTVDPIAGTYSAKIVKAGNAVNDPAWGTAAIAAS